MSSKRAKNTAEILANFISRVRPEDISPEIRDLAKLHLLDGIATMIGGLVLLLVIYYSRQPPRQRVGRQF